MSPERFVRTRAALWFVGVACLFVGAAAVPAALLLLGLYARGLLG